MKSDILEVEVNWKNVYIFLSHFQQILKNMCRRFVMLMLMFLESIPIWSTFTRKNKCNKGNVSMVLGDTLLYLVREALIWCIYVQTV